MSCYYDEAFMLWESLRAMMSSRAKYALRAAVYLAGQTDREGWVLASEIAAATQVPRKFLEAILVELRDHAIIVSQRGRYGGYRLARRPDEIHAGEVLRIVDGPLALAPCVSRTQPGTCLDCVDAATCPLRTALLAARDAMADVLDSRSLAEMKAEERLGGTAPAADPRPAVVRHGVCAPA
jgi:Rrf2 family protein